MEKALMGTSLMLWIRMEILYLEKGKIQTILLNDVLIQRWLEVKTPKCSVLE